MTYFNQIMAMTEANYPEMLKTCYLINGKLVFYVLNHLMKKFI